jgi:hypothetical protein
MDPNDRAITRILRGMAVIGAAGAVGAAFLGGLPALAGFAAGAAAAYFNFRWLKQLVEALGPGGKRPQARIAVFLGLRYLMLGIGAYAILRYSRMSLRAALAGLFVPVAAVLVEMLFELIYART